MDLDMKRWLSLNKGVYPKFEIDLTNLPTDQEVIDQILAVPEHLSASDVIDIPNTCVYAPSVQSLFGSASGALVGAPVDLLHATNWCNVYCAGGNTSGPVSILVQTSDGPASGVYVSGGGFPTSGSFTDPTSGLPQFPTTFISGGVWVVNSGLYSNVNAGYPASGFTTVLPAGGAPIFQAMGGHQIYNSGLFPVFASGGMAFAAFQRPQRWARALILSGAFTNGINVGFVSHITPTGSGGGQSQSPGSGTVNV